MTGDLPEPLQASFDRRTDPLDDPGICAWLEVHPERLAAFATLRAQLAALGPPPAPAARPSLRGPAYWRWPLLLAVAAAAVAAVAWQAELPRPHGAASFAVPSPDFAPGRPVCSMRSTLRVVGLVHTLATSTNCGRTTQQQRSSVSHDGAPSPAVPWCRASQSLDQIVLP